MNALRKIAVIDIGKTNAKVAMVDLESNTEIDVVTQPNTVICDGPYPHFDTASHWRFILQALKRFQSQYGIDGIAVTTHGACAALIAKNGSLAAPVLDYEFDGPDRVRSEYEKIRPSYALTGSPPMSGGLNLGAQLFWQFSEDQDLLGRTAHIVTYPQYWGYLLTGELACDVTSMGCHTDLWEPENAQFSSLVTALHIKDKIAPVRKSNDVLGCVSAEISTATGISEHTPVLCGIHDSNASLYPYILKQSSSFSVISSGTWVVVMSVGGTKVKLDPYRDLLLNVNALGQPVPSARFMGGREYEIIRNGRDDIFDENDLEVILQNGCMLLPAVVPTSGPFKNAKMSWVGNSEGMSHKEQLVALSLYLAMMSATCLELVGADGDIIIEGPFAQNTLYMQMLAAATDRPVYRSAAITGTAVGAALLFSDSAPLARLQPIELSEKHGLLVTYAQKWRALANSSL